MNLHAFTYLAQTPGCDRRSETLPPKRPEVLASSSMHRITQILAELNSGKPVTATTLCDAIKTSRSTVMRDIETMRTVLGVEIEYDPPHHTYRLVRPCTSLPLFRMDAREAIAFALASRFIGGGKQSPLGRLLDAILRKIAPVFGGAVSLAIDSVDQVLSHAGSDGGAAAEREMEHFFPLLDAILERRVLRLAYLKLGATAPETRTVHPLHLAEFQQRWRLVAFDSRRGRIRHFRLNRIHELESTGGSFEPPAGFDITAHLRGSLGIYSGEKEFEARIALDAHAAKYARETPWHPSQTLSDCPDGTTLMTLRLNHPTDALIAVLRWGDHVEVLEPTELRQQVRQTLESAAARYRDGK